MVASIEHELRSAGADWTTTLARSLVEMEGAVRQAVAAERQVWIGGGDGTVRDVLDGMAANRGAVAGIVPLGTVNALARALGTPLQPAAAARWLLDAIPRPMDTGEVGGRVFYCFASIGWDAAAVHAVRPAEKRILGRGAYLVGALRAVSRLRPPARFGAEIQPHDAPGNVIHDAGHSLIVSNIPCYAGHTIFHRAAPCSGSMELFLFRGGNPLTGLGWCAAQSLRRAPEPARWNVADLLVSRFSVRSRLPMHLQLDGDPVSIGDNTAYEFTVRPASVRILCR